MVMSEHTCLKPSVLETMGSSRKLPSDQLNTVLVKESSQPLNVYCSVRELCSIELTCVVPNMAL